MLRRKSWTATLDQSDPHTLFAARQAYGDQSMPGEDRSGGNTMQGCAAIFFSPIERPGIVAGCTSVEPKPDPAGTTRLLAQFLCQSGGAGDNGEGPACATIACRR